MRLGTRLECVGSIGSLLGWRKGVRRKKTETCRKDFAEGIGKVTRNMSGDRQRKTVRLAAGNVGGCRIAGVRS
ncbi:hypothetical protein BHM03_00060743 [Ensete ventricosum]|nr:hypothetical protein BHM03_00060743 [Ensete ventricosum]